MRQIFQFMLLLAAVVVLAPRVDADPVLWTIGGAGGPYTLNVTVTGASLDDQKPDSLQGTLVDKVEGRTYSVKGTFYNEKRISARVLQDGTEVGTLDGSRDDSGEFVFRFRGIRIVGNDGGYGVLEGKWLELNKENGRQRTWTIRYDFGSKRYSASRGARAFQVQGQGDKWVFTMKVDSPDDFDPMPGAEAVPTPVLQAIARKGMVVRYTMTLTRTQEMTGTMRALQFEYEGERLTSAGYRDWPVIWTKTQEGPLGE